MAPALFRHHHHPETVAERIDQLMVAVFSRDELTRVAQLAQHLAPDFVYISPGAVVEGAPGLSDAFIRFRHDEWRHPALRRTTEVDVHHAHFRYAWARSEAGHVVMEGWSFGWMNDAGLISQIVSFDGLLTGPGS
jgi:hypothetical protein